MEIIKFLPNRVLRLYRGGSGLDRLGGRTDGADTRFPEDWIASCIEGNGRAYHSPGHGLSKVIFDNKEWLFADLLKAYPLELLGQKHVARYGAVPAVLVKLLDSAEQLPLQVHPTREQAKKLLNSDYGKTEAWIVLATRKVNGEEPYLLAGFNHNLDKEVFLSECRAGKLDRAKSMLHQLSVEPGDVVLIRGGLPHAIGPGITMVEIMEPSDWVVVPEVNCCGVALTESQRFMGLDPATALEIFDDTPVSADEARERYLLPRKTVERTGGGCLQTLISPRDCELFSAEELTVDGSYRLDNPSFAIGVVTAGKLDFDKVTVSAGGGLFVPFITKQLKITGTGNVILIRPPQNN